MTMGEFIRRTDEIKPNAYSLGQKAAWLGEMEGQIWTELLLQPAGDWDSVTHAQRPLLLPEVWQRLYSAYLSAMIDLANGEYTKYSNAMALYNGQVQEFAAWYGENFRPADRVYLGYVRPMAIGQQFSVNFPAADDENFFVFTLFYLVFQLVIRTDDYAVIAYLPP